MKIWQLALKVYLKKDILMDEYQIEISKIIDGCLTKDVDLLRFHNNNLGTGLLEMNSRGYGYVNYKWL